MKQKIASVLRFIVGFIFLLSGLLKATDAATFADLISKYGYLAFGYAAPVIIGVEIVLGLLLIFNIRPRVTAIASVTFILGVSAIFAYGFLALGITNCGCFGPMQLLNSKPLLTFVRNAILVALLVPSFIGEQKEAQWTKPIAIFMTLALAIVMFLSGFSFKEAKCTDRANYYRTMHFSNSPLSELVSLNPDSTYVVFAFSYTCPYCQTSMGNVKQYMELGLVDKIIGVCVNDTTGQERFLRLYKPGFEIREIEPMQMLSIVSELPTIFEVRHDTIVRQYSGMVISPAIVLP